MNSDIFSSIITAPNAKIIKNNTIRQTFKNISSDQNLFMLESRPHKFENRVDIKKACKYTGLCYQTFYDKFRYGKIPHTYFGRKPTFELKDISDYIISHKVGDWSRILCTDEEIVYEEKVDIKECCKMTGLCYNTFYTNMIRDNIPHIKYGNKRIFLKKQIKDWITTKEKGRMNRHGKCRTN